MRKITIFIVFIFFAVSSFAQNMSTRSLFIEGITDREDHLEFFLTNFTMEARIAGYNVTRRKAEADFTFRFVITPNMVMIDDELRPVSPEDSQFALNISIVNNRNNSESVSFDFYFSELIEMYPFTQFLFHRATAAIPPFIGGDRIDRVWQNKWLYFRASLNYPIVFHELQPTGLIGGIAAYEGLYESPGELMLLRSEIQPQPGITLGLEFQFLNFMSIEANIQTTLGDTSTYAFFNWAAGCELKFPIKTQYFMLQPYIKYLYNINPSPIFSQFPSSSLGGGIQIAVRGGREGAFFIDFHYLHALGDVFMDNPYRNLAPNPASIHYNRFVLGLGLGYKYGSFDRVVTKQ
jgi:hypothetical protein